MAAFHGDVMRALLAGLVVAASLSNAAACPEAMESVEAPPVAIAIVVNGAVLAMGNETYEPQWLITGGMLPQLTRELDRLDLANKLPFGSVATVITYSDGATVRVPMRRVDMLDGITAFGTQKDYTGHFGWDLASGVELGLAQLALTNAKTKFLVVLGDGDDTNETSDQLRLLRERAQQDHVTPIAVTYKHALSEEDDVVAFDHHAERVYEVNAILPRVWARIQLARAGITSKQVASSFVVSSTTCHVGSRTPLVFGSVLALLVLMGGVWFIRQEKPGQSS
jgi:hypothetical protein